MNGKMMKQWIPELHLWTKHKCQSSASITVKINPNPSISISSSQNPTDVGNSVTFSSSESGGTGSDTYVWSINGVQESTASSFSYSFSASGVYYVNVTVRDTGKVPADVKV